MVHSYLIAEPDLCSRGQRKEASVPENILKCLFFFPLCMAPSTSMTSLQQTLKLSLHIHISLILPPPLSIYLLFIILSSVRVPAYSHQPPSFPPPISIKSILSHTLLLNPVHYTHLYQQSPVISFNNSYNTVSIQ